MLSYRFTCVCSCSVMVASAMLVAQAAAEPVQTTLTVDANTTSLWRFKEGTGTTSANDVTGKPVIHVGNDYWVPGRQYYALATGRGLGVGYELRLCFRRCVASPPDRHDFGGLGKIQLCDRSVDSQERRIPSESEWGSYRALFTVDGGSYSINGVLPVPAHQWIHLAVTYQRTSATTASAWLYVNGVLDTTANFTGMTTGLLPTGYGSKFILGNIDWVSLGGSEVDGKVDAVRISNIARVFTPLYPTPPEPATPRGNLVPNGDFEIGLTGWRNDNIGDLNLAWETTGGAASGQKCLHSLPVANPQVYYLLCTRRPSRPPRPTLHI